MEKIFKVFLILCILFIFSNVSALCEEGQIDINSASLEELDNLYGIGPVKAEAIINSRPFGGVDDLINVYGIGEVTLQKIKEQGLACVVEEKEEVEETKEENNEEIETEKEDVEITGGEENNEEEGIEVIKLDTKSIKSENNKEDSGKNNYVIYGFVFFCILLSFLFILKNRTNKNEFR